MKDWLLLSVAFYSYICWVCCVKIKFYGPAQSDHIKWPLALYCIMYSIDRNPNVSVELYVTDLEARWLSFIAFVMLPQFLTLHRIAFTHTLHHSPHPHLLQYATDFCTPCQNVWKVVKYYKPKKIVRRIRKSACCAFSDIFSAYSTVSDTFSTSVAYLDSNTLSYASLVFSFKH